MEAESGELQDWELLHNVSDSDEKNLKELDGFEGDSEGVIRSDYFSLESKHRYERYVSRGEEEEVVSVESDNPSWIDPGCSENLQFESRNSREFWSDSSSDRSVELKFGDSAAKNGLVSAEFVKSHECFEGIGKVETQGDDSSKFWSDSGGDESVLLKSELPNEENGLISDLCESNADYGRSFEVESQETLIRNETESDHVAIKEVRLRSDEENRGVIWWKLPLELLKYCAFRSSPVWSVSVAAAVMGIVMLGRRLYKMKRKARTLQLKVTMDNQKVSQFMTRVARLNEAFSVVRRVPMIRPSMPAVTGVTPWPVMSLR